MKARIAERIADTLLDQLERSATIQVDCKAHGRFRHSPIEDIKPGVCPDCYFQDGMPEEYAL